jgi:hypothetical protein
MRPSRRNRLAFVSLVWVLGVFSQLAWPSTAWSCTCARPAGPPCSLGIGEVVFVGRATSVSKIPVAAGGIGFRRFKFTVSEGFAGVSATQVDVESDTTSCGVDFAEGPEYLVAGSRGPDGIVRVHACSYTSSADDARVEIEILRALRSGAKLPQLYGQVIEFRKPGPNNRATDPELYPPMSHVRVTVAGADIFRETFTDGEGRFMFGDLPLGQYRVDVRVKAPKRVLPYRPGFHQSAADPAAVSVQACPSPVNFTVSEWNELIASLPPLLAPQSCERESQLRSPASTTRATIHFDNGRSDPVRVYWLDFVGHRVLYHSLAAGQTFDQETYAEHRWVVATEDGRCLGLYKPLGERSIADIR